MAKLKLRSVLGSALAAPVILLAAYAAEAANLTDATREALKAAKVPAALMEGLDEELALAKSLLDAARKEGKVRVRMTTIDRHFEGIRKMFNARYPEIEIEYFVGVGNERALVPLLALRQGKYLSDVISSIDVLLDEFNKIDALADISDLPAYKTAPKELSGEILRRHQTG